MRQCVLLALLVAVCAAHPGLFGKDDVLRFSPQNQFDDAFEAKWADYKETHGRKYETESEENVRKFIFQANLKQIEEHNILAAKGEKSFTMGINEYSDMTHEEFVKTFNGFKKTEKQKTNRIEYLSPAMPVSLPDEVDWRKHGYVTPVKNQGQCGSCWAFSTTGCLEGQHMRKTGKLVSLSEQNLVDCSGSYGNHGCEGGLMDLAYDYIQKYGIDTEESYPYEAVNGECRYNKADVGATDKGEVDIQKGDEDKLKEACATLGPISVAIDAGHASFQQYSGGIYDEPECNPDDLDHGVLVVGYGTENGQDYWLVKNSWGTSWGMSGYIKMLRNKDNACGIASMASYPIV